MKICIFAKGLPVHIIGGLELHTQDLINGLTKRGHHVTVITTKHPSGIKMEKLGNIKIFYVGDEPLRYNNKFCIESAKLFDEIDKTENFDIVHSIHYFGAGFAKYSKSRKPMVVSMHGTEKYEIRSILNEKSMKIIYMVPYMFLKSFLFYNPLDRALFKKARIIMVDSKELRRDVISEYKIPTEKMALIYDGIDIKKFKPINVKNFRKKLKIGIDEKIILSSGRIVKQKGYHLVIEILPEILKEMKVKLIITGEGDYLQHLKNLAEKMKITDKIIFTGKVSKEDLVKYYNLADVFVFPTLRVEAFGIVVAEAMACGKPTISSRTGGIPSVVDDSKNGFLIKMGNLNELEHKTLEILKDSNLARTIGKNARKKVVENFSMDKMIMDIESVYLNVINDSGENIELLEFNK
jgi:glycosyltransferase involved in cell wall biosynthesis